MFWLKKRFHAPESYGPSQEMLEKLMFANPTKFAEFLMFCTDTDKPLVSDVYVGLPDKMFASGFKGFESVQESELPKEIDTFLFGDQTKQPFTDRFKFRGK